MKRVDSYIDNVCKNLNGSTEEINNLREEMKMHILEMINELEASGNTKEESISIALCRFGEENKVEKELLKEFKEKRSIKKPVIIAIAVLVILLVGNLIYGSYKVNIWVKDIELPVAITIRDKMDAQLIEGTINFEGQVDINDKTKINNLVNIIMEAKNKSSCSERQANNFNINKVSFSIGTIDVTTQTQENRLSTMIIFKNGSFIAGKYNSNDECVYIKGRLEDKDMKYIEEIYNNPYE